MVFSTPLGLLSSSMLIQMRIGQVIRLIDAPSQVFVSYWVLLVSWHSEKQDVVSYSNIEVEYHALVDTTYKLVQLQWLLADTDAPQPTSTPLYCDNRSTIYIAHNNVFHKCTKHIEINCHITRQQLKKGNLQLFSISSVDQPADIFTKTYSPGCLRDLISKLQLASSLPPRV